MKVSQFLELTKSRIATPDRWCRRFSAVDRHYSPVQANSTNAVKFCAYGALIAGENLVDKETYILAVGRTDRVAYAQTGNSLVATNDNYGEGFDAIHRIFDQAILESKNFETTNQETNK